MVDDRLFAIVLAAGSSSRFGSTKQLAEHDGVPLVRRAMRLAEAVCGRRSVCVVGCDWQRVVEAADPHDGFFVLNDEWQTGLGSSIGRGIRAVDGCAGAALLMLADQPVVTSDHLRRLIDASEAAPDDIVASAYSETSGPPVIFPQAYFGALAQLQGDVGARALLAEHAANVRCIESEQAGIDIDRPADLDRLI